MTSTFKYFPILALYVIIGTTVFPLEIYLFLAFSCIAILLLKKGSLKISNDVLLLSLLFLYSVLCSLVIYFLNWDLIDNQIASYQFFAIRKAVFDFLIAISVYIYLKNKDFKYTVNLISFCFLINTFLIFIEFIFGMRPPSALFLEPSSSAYFSISFFIVFYYFFVKQLDSYKIVVTTLVIFMSLLTNSKIYLLFIIILGSFYAYRKLNLLFFTCILTTSILFIYLYLAQYNSQIYSMILFFSEFTKDGIYSLNSDSGIYGTFITRLSSIFISLKVLFENPLGIGIGLFPFFYLDSMLVDGYIDIFYGSEINKYFNFESFPSSKSSLLAFLLSSGVFGAVFLFYIFFKCAKKNTTILLSYIFFLFASFFIELNNFFLYLCLFLILIEKHNYSEDHGSSISTS